MSSTARLPCRRFLALGAAALLLTAPTAARAALLVDDFEDGDATNALGGAWQTVTDGSSTTSGFMIAPGNASLDSGHFGYSIQSGVQYPFVTLATFLSASRSTTGIDLSAYAGVRFTAKGSGTFAVEVATSETAAEYNYYQAALIAPADWTEFQIPFSSLSQTFGTAQPWDPKAIFAVEWQTTDGAGTRGELYLDNVEFYTTAEALPPQNNPIIAAPKINQLGFLTHADKIFHVTAGAPLQPGDAFTVLEAATGKTVASGTLGAEAVDDTAASGEWVFAGDFSSLTAPGSYVVSVDGAESPPFSIGDAIYDSLFRDALRAFSIIRCGVAIDDAETGIQHPACHTVDAVLRDDPSQSVDLTGGWHNAGDFGKETHEAAISVSYMMWLYELDAAAIGAIDTGIPESGNAMPDILDEARWGLTWLLKMQQADGSVMHKVDTEPNFAWGLSPNQDPNARSAGLASTIDAADFVGVMEQAARVYKSLDPIFAAKCLAAAERAWTWVEANPNVGETDRYYPDADPSQEVTWALGEMVRATHDPVLTKQFSASVKAAVVQGANVQGWTLSAVNWQTPELFGYVAVALDPEADATLQSAVVAKMGELGDNLAQIPGTTGYDVATIPAWYGWESNEELLHRAAALLFASAATGRQVYKGVALRQLDWLLGDNSLSRAFVTGYGSNPIAHPYHWTAYALGKLMPGWGGGGPNPNPSGADPLLRALISQGTPPAKCYVDQGNASGSYASNEGEISENAALAFVTGSFVSGGAPTASSSSSSSGMTSTSGAIDIRPKSSALAPSGGCGCRAAGSTAIPGLPILLVVTLASALRRRRRTVDA